MIFAVSVLVGCGSSGSGSSGQNATDGGLGGAGGTIASSGGTSTGGNASGGVVGGGGTTATGGSSGGTATGGSTSNTGGGNTGGVSAGGTNTGGTSASGGTGGSSGMCLGLYARCDTPGATCCAGTTCAQSAGTMTCQATCQQDSDCGSRCCAFDSTAGANLCKTPTACCSNEGEHCDNALEFCCDNMVCVAYTDTSLNNCRPVCSTDNDCSSGCCKLFSGQTYGYCGTTGECSCVAVDQPCGGASGPCCDGLACTVYDPNNTSLFACKPTCTTNANCATNCCVSNGTDSVCLSSVFCN